MTFEEWFDEQVRYESDITKRSPFELSSAAFLAGFRQGHEVGSKTALDEVGRETEKRHDR
jgi:hypothetical protein